MHTITLVRGYLFTINYNKVPLFFWFDPFKKLGQKSVKNLGRFLGNGVSSKIAFEIYWLLVIITAYVLYVITV